MKRILITFSCLAVVAMAVSCKKEQKSTVMPALVVQSVVGDVTVDRSGTVSAVREGQVLAEGARVITGKQSTADILCGSEGVIRVNELSSMTVGTAINSEKGYNAVLNLEKGKVFASIAKMKKDSSLSVKTPTAVAAVRGTSFRVSTTDKGSSVDVLSGKVQMNPVVDDKVIETVSTVVETNKTAEITEKDAKVMAAEKKEIVVETLPPSAATEIKTESAGIAVAKSAPVELKQELDQVGIKTIEVDVKPLPEPEKTPDSTQSDIKDDSAQKALLEKQENERLAKEKAEKAQQDKAEKDRLAKEKADQERLAKDQAEKERAAQAKAAEEQRQREIAAKAQAEKERQQKEQEQKESRVKNIPNM